MIVRPLLVACLTLAIAASVGADQGFRPVPLVTRAEGVQPQTGLVLWTSSQHVETDAIQLEYRYLGYDEVAVGLDDSGGVRYDWSELDRTLERVAARGHQLILRMHFEWPGRPTTVPEFLKSRGDYRETHGHSEGRATSFADWRSAELREFTLDFYTAFARRYDRDPRLAFVQTGFGLWAEYHIYDGPMLLGVTFPDKAYQARFAEHLGRVFRATPWMVSIDAHDAERSPLAESDALRALPFGLFDDSLMHRRHAQENARWWAAFGADRWRRAPAGGELSYYTRRDQVRALDPQGPHGAPFERFARDFHLSFAIANDQPDHQPMGRLREAGRACGYRMRLVRYEASGDAVRLAFVNEGVAPLYYDAYPSVGGVRAAGSLRGLCPGERREFVVEGLKDPRSVITIESDRLVAGQRIGFDADLGGE